jgi:hypothetical protein
MTSNIAEVNALYVRLIQYVRIPKVSTSDFGEQKCSLLALKEASLTSTMQLWHSIQCAWHTWKRITSSFSCLCQANSVYERYVSSARAVAMPAVWQPREHAAEDLEGRLRCGLSADLQTYALCYALYNALHHALHHNYMPALQSWQNNFVGAGGKSSSIDRCPGLP